MSTIRTGSGHRRESSSCDLVLAFGRQSKSHSAQPTSAVQLPAHRTNCLQSTSKGMPRTAIHLAATNVLANAVRSAAISRTSVPSATPPRTRVCCRLRVLAPRKPPGTSRRTSAGAKDANALQVLRGKVRYIAARQVAEDCF
jgi:hypothetical protein